MYNPYENNSNNEANEQTHNNSADRPVDDRQSAAPGYATGANPYTAQTSPVQPAQTNTDQTGTPQTGAGQPAPSVTYHTGPVHTGSAYFPQQSTPAYSQPQQAPKTAYTWNQNGQPGQPGQPGAPYYAPVMPQKQKKPKKHHGGKFALKVLAAVLACAVVSFGSVGAFALMIQNGVINIQSSGEANTTAAFTIYKQAESSSASTPTVTNESMTAQEVAKKVTPSVVCIQNYQITQQSSYGFFFGYGYGSDDSEDDSSISPAGEGSGIIISKDGYIVTNQHVIADATSLKVVTSEGLTYEAELVGEDTQTDLAVIKVNTDDELTPAEFGSSEDLQVADEVMAIGNPGGLQLNSSVTFGHISALNRQIEDSETGYTMKCIQTDAAINPGNSGGALVDMNGYVVGINSSKIVATEYEGLGFAIPSDTVQPVVSDLMEYGYVKDRPMLGISGQYVDSMTASFYNLPAGYYVVQVNSENAQKAGLQRGDVITAIDDTQVTSVNTISTYIANKKPGDTVTLTVNRSTSGEGTVQIELVLSENTGKSSDESSGEG